MTDAADRDYREQLARTIRDLEADAAEYGETELQPPEILAAFRDALTAWDTGDRAGGLAAAERAGELHRRWIADLSLAAGALRATAADMHVRELLDRPAETTAGELLAAGRALSVAVRREQALRRRYDYRGPVTGERAQRQLRLADLVAAAQGDPDRARDELVRDVTQLIGQLEDRARVDVLLTVPLALALNVVATIEAARDSRKPGTAWGDLWALLPLYDSLRDTVATARGTAGAGAIVLPSPTVSGSGSVTVSEAAGATLVPVSDRAAALARMPDTVALERHLARSPIWTGSRDAVRQLAFWRHVGSLYGRPFRLLTPMGPLTVRDALLLSHLTRRFADDGFPADRRVRFSLTEGARWLGYSSEGGAQRQRVRDALGRLRASTFEHLARFADGHQETLTWGILDLGRTTTRDGGRGMAVFSEPLAQLIREGSLTYLDAPTFRELVERDELAARLWMFLETEDYGRPWRLSLYSAPEGEPEAERDTPAIADLLAVSHWQERRQVARRVREAAAIVTAQDPRYSLAVERAKGQGMWNLTIVYAADATMLPAGKRGRKGGTPGHAEGVTAGTPGGNSGHAGGYSGARDRAQKGGVPSYLPSASTVEYLPSTKAPETLPNDETGTGSRKLDTAEPPDVAALLERWPRVSPGQRRQLAEIADRHDLTGREWAARIIRGLPADHPDPFRAVLDADRDYQHDRDREAQDREAREARERADREAGHGLGRLGGLTPAIRPETAPPIVPVARLTPRTPTPPDPEVAARRRAMAESLLAAEGLDPIQAAELRRRYGLDESEASGDG